MRLCLQHAPYCSSGSAAHAAPPTLRWAFITCWCWCVLVRSCVGGWVGNVPWLVSGRPVKTFGWLAEALLRMSAKCRAALGGQATCMHLVLSPQLPPLPPCSGATSATSARRRSPRTPRWAARLLCCFACDPFLLLRALLSEFVFLRALFPEGDNSDTRCTTLLPLFFLSVNFFCFRRDLHGAVRVRHFRKRGSAWQRAQQLPNVRLACHLPALPHPHASYGACRFSRLCSPTAPYGVQVVGGGAVRPHNNIVARAGDWVCEACRFVWVGGWVGWVGRWEVGGAASEPCRWDGCGAVWFRCKRLAGVLACRSPGCIVIAYSA